MAVVPDPPPLTPEVARSSPVSRQRPGRGAFLSGEVRWWGLLSAAVLVASIATVAGFFGRLWWVLELASHFRLQYSVFLAGAFFIALLLGRWSQAGVSGVLSVVNLTLIVPLYLGGASAASGDPSIRVVLANVNSTNTAYEKFHQFLGTTRPDVIVVEELNQRWARELEAKQSDYRFSRTAVREDNFGIGLFSRLPFVSAEIVHLGTAWVPSVVARFEIEGQPLTVIGTHPVPPAGRAYAEYRNEQLHALALFVAAERGPIAILGDLNVTSWSPVFSDFLRATGLHDSRRGYGLQPTWPVGLPMFLIPIDHCLVSADVVVRARWVGPNIGSDHYPVVIDMAIGSPRERRTSAPAMLNPW
jgi:endonuclease/exonuclease/phosphatase (EEP) superfamily protein YafD